MLRYCDSIHILPVHAAYNEDLLYSTPVLHKNPPVNFKFPVLSLLRIAFSAKKNKPAASPATRNTPNIYPERFGKFPPLLLLCFLPPCAFLKTAVPFLYVFRKIKTPRNTLLILIYKNKDLFRGAGIFC